MSQNNAAAPLACRFATEVKVNGPNRFEFGTLTSEVHVSRGALHPESIPWSAPGRRW
jgi:hypothetical protein